MAGRIGLDTETTGLDISHGARPYFVGVSYREGNEFMTMSWSWKVDPVTRRVLYDTNEMEEVQDLLDSVDEIVIHNAKFDFRALDAAFRDVGMNLRWDWSKVRDSLIASHLVNSIPPHNLATMSLVYLGLDTDRFDKDLKSACMKARRIASRKGWRVSGPDQPDMPSVKGEAWKMDGWIPGQLAVEEGYPPDHEWMTVLERYCEADTISCLELYRVLSESIGRNGLRSIYDERMKVVPIVAGMETNGVSISRRRLERQLNEYRKQSEELGAVCTGIASDRYRYDLTLPKSGNNKSLLSFIFDTMELPVVKKSGKTGVPSLDQSVVGEYLATLPEESDGFRFMRSLSEKRRRDTGISYMEGYRRFWIPLDGSDEWYTLHPSLNPTGTGTLRWSSSNPNEQNISKKEGFNLRYCFGPAPGREWWSLDYKNLELRIPAFESDETDLIHVFEHPDDPPYFGSYHLVVADLLYPREFRRYGTRFKDKFISTKYKWIKNGNFAVIYGAQRETADRAYHIDGAYDAIRSRFPRIAELNDRMISMAGRTGYVETIPDRSITDSGKGYPIRCPRGYRGLVSPTVPLNYHVQSTAMWITMKAMIRCQGYLDSIGSRNEYRMVMQVHDELVFDFPRRSGRGNLPKVRRLARLMALGGDDVGIPTPVSIEYHPNDWSTGESVH